MNIGFAIRLYLDSLRKNFGINMMSTGIIGLALLILGLFVLVGYNLGAVVRHWGDQIQISAYLEDGLDATATDKVRRGLLEMEDVAAAQYVSKDEALKLFREMLAGEADLLRGIEGNPMPASFEVKLAEGYRTLEGVERAAERIASIKGVDEVSYGREWLGNFLSIIRIIRLVTVVVGALILASAVFIIYNTIKLTVYSRREEIGIMKLVGATDFFIRLPFLMEGVTQGVISALLSVLVLWLVFAAFLGSMVLPFNLLAGISPSFLPGYLVVLFVLGGALLGIIGSMVSFREFIKV